MVKLVVTLWLLVCLAFVLWLFWLYTRTLSHPIQEANDQIECPDCRGAGGLLLWFGRLITFPLSWSGPQKRVAANTFMCKRCTGRGYVRSEN